MKKGILAVCIAVMMVAIVFSGCTENNGSNKDKQNQLPIPVLTQGKYPIWWNDILYINAKDSYDSDGNISEYTWFFETRYTDSLYSTVSYGESRTGISTFFVLPDSKYNVGYGKLTLAVTDDKGATAFAHYNISIRHSPFITFKQINSSRTTFNILYVEPAINTTGYVYPLKEEEISIQCYKYDPVAFDDPEPWKWFQGLYNLGDYNDVNEDGNVTYGDTFAIDDLFITSNKVKIELVGGPNHNTDTIVGTLEVEI